MSNPPWEFKDPEQLLEEVAAAHELVMGEALLAVVERPPTEQLLVHVERLPVDSRIDHYAQVRDLLYETMQTMPGVPEWEPGGRHVGVMTIVVRPGLTVMGPHEAQWMSGWRYSNHMMGAFDGHLILVTEHGWLEFMTGWGGHGPRAVIES